MGDELRRASAVERDHRFAHGHGFQEGDRARLLEGGHREHVGRREELRDVRAKASENDVTFQPQLLGQRLELGFVASSARSRSLIVFAHDEELEVFVRRPRLGERLQEIGVSLPVKESRDDREEHRVGRDAELLANRS